MHQRITELEESEIERKRMEEKRRRLERLAILGEMSAILAREIRNPIASISTGLRYLALLRR